MAPSDTFAQPAFSKVIVSFTLGLAVGFGFVLPAVREDLSAFALSNPGPVGSVLMIGVFSMVVVTTGLFALYRLFWLVDR